MKERDFLPESINFTAWPEQIGVIYSSCIQIFVFSSCNEEFYIAWNSGGCQSV